MLAHADVYTDFQGLGRLKSQARADAQGALEQVAGQFEALFTQMMLKSMRDASFGGGILDNDQTELYQGMYDQQLALSLSQGRGLGIRDALVEQFGRYVPQSESASEEQTAPQGPFTQVPERSHLQPQQVRKPAAAAQAATQAPELHQPEPIAPPRDKTEFRSQEDFVQTLWPHAVAAGETLGVEPEVILAQAALETGWGQGVVRTGGGESSYNLFNIKADSRWDGGRAQSQTLEFEQGAMVRRRESFRTYDSYAESFADYTRFLQQNPRYHGALAQAEDPVAYLDGLQAAGYATDPDYADKIMDILSRQPLANVNAALKNLAERPMTT